MGFEGLIVISLTPLVCGDKKTWRSIAEIILHQREIRFECLVRSFSQVMRQYWSCVPWRVSLSSTCLCSVSLPPLSVSLCMMTPTLDHLIGCGSVMFLKIPHKQYIAVNVKFKISFRIFVAFVLSCNEPDWYLESLRLSNGKCSELWTNASLC